LNATQPRKHNRVMRWPLSKKALFLGRITNECGVGFVRTTYIFTRRPLQEKVAADLSLLHRRVLLCGDEIPLADPRRPHCPAATAFILSPPYLSRKPSHITAVKRLCNLLPLCFRVSCILLWMNDTKDGLLPRYPHHQPKTPRSFPPFLKPRQTPTGFEH